jgi:serine/threonine-protein kinase
MFNALGRYQIGDLIGQGAMAMVYKAFDPEIRRPLAVKVLLPELSRDPEHRARFLGDAKGAGGLAHPNIVTVFDVGEQEQHPYIAMELVEGTTLSQRLRAKEPLPTREALEIGIQLAKALDYAHKRGIVHRDVKPGNILMLKNSNTVKLGDFGICRFAADDATQHTKVGTILGTPHYMSPEQTTGKADVDGRSDLFSAGVVLYQMLTGVRPFEGDSLIEVGLKIWNAEPEPLEKLRPDLPRSLHRIVSRALRKQPEKRFQSGEEMANALITVVREIDDAEQSSDHGRRIPMRVRWALILAAIVAVTMLLATAFIQQRQHTAMRTVMVGYGGSLTKLMAAQYAEPMLVSNFTQVEAFMKSAMDRQNFSYVHILDHEGVVQVSTDQALVGKAYAVPGGEPVYTREQGIAVDRRKLDSGAQVYDFNAPILFSDKEVGQVHVGIFDTPLADISRLTVWLLGFLILLTSAAVAAGSYVLAKRFSRPLRLLRDSLVELANGRYDYRINEERKDEFAEVFAAFDDTASALQKRHETTAPKTGNAK